MCGSWASTRDVGRKTGSSSSRSVSGRRHFLHHASSARETPLLCPSCLSLTALPVPSQLLKSLTFVSSTPRCSEPRFCPAWGRSGHPYPWRLVQSQKCDSGVASSRSVCSNNSVTRLLPRLLPPGPHEPRGAGQLPVQGQVPGLPLSGLIFTHSPARALRPARLAFLRWCALPAYPSRQVRFSPSSRLTHSLPNVRLLGRKCRSRGFRSFVFYWLLFL